MIKFGLIGKSLKHSFSKQYFEKKFREQGLENYSYDLFEINAIEDLKTIIAENEGLQGLNVTIPYKESVIPFLDELSPEAKEIGAVNCIHFEKNKRVGYNTDAYGFSQSIKPFLDTNHQRALILGTGGASKAVAYSLKKVGVEIYFVTLSLVKKTGSTFFYSEINALVMDAFKLIINTTPLGTFPKIDECPPLPYHLFTPQHLVYDLVYNPEQSLFLKQAKQQGSITVNGLSMLQLQAEKNWEIWNTK